MYPPTKDQLEKEVELGNVRKYNHPHLPISGYVYTQQCELNNAWNKINKWARGIVFDNNANLIALPFPKFFNLNQTEETILSKLPEEPFEVTIKQDGSLIILFNYNGQWLCSTKGSFNSEQAYWAMEKIKKYNFVNVPENLTILLEAVYPENRIVVDYSGKEFLFFLSCYDRIGKYEVMYPDTISMLENMFSPREILQNKTVEDLLNLCRSLPGLTNEGFVVRFWSGLRVKIKGQDYLRIHKLISHATPISVWEALEPLTTLNKIPKVKEEYWNGIPDEFVDSLKIYEQKLSSSYEKILKDSIELLNKAKVSCNNRKEFANFLKTDKELFSICMNLLDNKLNKIDKIIKDKIRPVGNKI